MKNKDICDRIRECLECMNMDIDSKNVKTTSDLRTDVGMDSLDILEFVNYLEDYFNIDILDADTEQWITMGDVCKTLSTYLGD